VNTSLHLSPIVSKKGFKEFQFTLHSAQEFSAIGCILVLRILSSHKNAGWKEPQEVSSLNSWLKCGQLWDHTMAAQGLIQMLLGSLQEGGSHSCPSEQYVLKLDDLQW